MHKLYAIKYSDKPLHFEQNAYLFSERVLNNNMKRQVCLSFL